MRNALKMQKNGENKSKLILIASTRFKVSYALHSGSTEHYSIPPICSGTAS